MASLSVESQMLRIYSSDIHETLVHPREAALLLYQEGIFSEEVVDEADNSTKKSVPEKNAAVMKAVRAAVKADRKKLWVLIAVLERFAECAPVASKMKHELRSRGLWGRWRSLSQIITAFALTFNYYICFIDPRQNEDIHPASVSAAKGLTHS